MACSVPPRPDSDEVPAVDEARALLPAYRRAVEAVHGRTTVGRVVDADGVPGAVRAIARLASGAPWADCHHSGTPPDVVLDIRAYYEEAATALAGHVPAARAAEVWFYRHTEAGKAVLAAQRVLRADHDADTYQLSLYMSPIEEAPPPDNAGASPPSVPKDPAPA